MPIGFRRIMFCVILTGIAGLGLSAAEPPRTIKGWGVVSDPMVYSKFDLDKDTLAITAPDDYVDNYGSKVNAPAVMQDVSGDFTVEVKVVYLDKALPNTVHESLNFPTAYHSGTLLIRHDKQNFVRFERVSMNRGGQEVNQCALHIYKDQQRAAFEQKGIKYAPTNLRLERRGKTVLASFSQDDGKTWEALPSQDIGHLPESVKAGVSLTSNTQNGATVKFTGLKLEKAKKK